MLNNGQYPRPTVGGSITPTGVLCIKTNRSEEELHSSIGKRSARWRPTGAWKRIVGMVTCKSGHYNLRKALEYKTLPLVDSVNLVCHAGIGQNAEPSSRSIADSRQQIDPVRVALLSGMMLGSDAAIGPGVCSLKVSADSRHQIAPVRVALLSGMTLGTDAPIGPGVCA